MRRSKRKAQRAEERSGGNVIPLPRGRADASTAQEIRGPGREVATAEQLDPQPARAARSAEQLATHADIHHEDDHPDIRNFFADAAKSAPPASGQWSDLETTDHDITPPPQRHPRGMYWTAGIGGVGLLFIGVFLLYHKVLMPTPEELGTTKVVALPTPDMVKSAPEPRAAEPASTPRAAPSPATDTPSAPVPSAPTGALPTAAPEAPSGGSAVAPGSAAAPASAPEPGSATASEGKPAGTAIGSASTSAGASGAAPASGAGATSASAPGNASSAAEPANTARGSSAASAGAPATRAPAPVPAPAARTSAGAQTAPNAQAAKQSSLNYEQALAEARKLGYRRSAEAAYLRALEANPKGAEALSGLAMLYLNFGDNTRAKQRAEQALARDPNSAEAWIVLGSAQSALGKYVEARQAYVRCAALANSKYVSECKRMLH